MSNDSIYESYVVKSDYTNSAKSFCDSGIEEYTRNPASSIESVGTLTKVSVQ
jgi:hypothetical protein